MPASITLYDYYTYYLTYVLLYKHKNNILIILSDLIMRIP